MHSFVEYRAWWLKNRGAIPLNVEELYRQYLRKVKGELGWNSYPVRPIYEVNQPPSQSRPKGFHISEVINMQLCVLRVQFTSGGKLYNYLAPDDFDPEVTEFVVVPSANMDDEDTVKDKKFEPGHFTIAKVKEKLDTVYPVNENNLRHIVVGFSVQNFVEFNKKLLRRRALLSKLEEMAKQVSQIDTIKKLLGDDPAAKVLLDELDGLR